MTRAESLSEKLEVDRQLLFGLLALQNRFIERPELIASFRVWSTHRSKPLAAVFEERGAMVPSSLRMLEALFEHFLKLNGDDSTRCLAVLDPSGTFLGVAHDLDLDPMLPEPANPNETDPEDPYATRDELFIPETVPPTNQADPSGSYSSRSDSYHSLGSGASRFRVLRLHAKGGLGQVSLALDEELGRQVALKEIQDHHADHPEYRSRFVREAEITGKLEHPGIIPIYGLGRDLSGRPYYAMRFINGDNLEESIARYHRFLAENPPASDRTLQLRELLGRFLDICNAIAYAHSRRVIHRDLKPGNILLGPFGETLVVDWGLAKPLDDDDRSDDPDSLLGPIRPLLEGSDSTPTMAGVAHGTPAYMSPEQAEGRLDRIGPASDVYSLGATLYHILTGRAPFGGQNVLRRVSAGDFRPPRKIREDIPPALEAICLKAMATRLEDRFESSEALAGDLKLWLADEQVSAWREPFSVRAGRWIKRHRTTVTSAAAVFLVSLVALVAIGVTLAGKNRELRIAERTADLARVRAERALRFEKIAKDEAEASARAESLAKIEAEAARARAEIEASTAKRTKDFLVSIFVATDPLALFTGGTSSKSRRGSQSAVEILDQGAKKIDTELKDAPLIQASLMESIGNALRSKAEFVKADPLLRQSLAIRRLKLRPDAPEIADSLENLGWMLQDQGKTAEALKLFEEALAVRRPRFGDHHPLVARVMFHMAWLFAEDGRIFEAEPIFRKVLAILEAHPELSRDLAIARLGFAGMLVDTGRYLEAFPFILSALKSQMNEVGMEEGIKSVSLFQIGVIARNGKMGRLAERSLKESLEIASKLLGEDHPYNVFILFTLAGLYADQKRLDEAESLYRRCLTICRDKAAMGYPRVVQVVSEFALFLDRRGKFPEASSLYQEMIKSRKARFSADHVMIAEGLVFQGAFLRLVDPRQSESIFREALEIYRKHPDYRSARSVECHEMLGEILFNRQRYDEAERQFRLALDLIAVLPASEMLDREDSRAWDFGHLGASILHQRRYPEAEAALQKSIELYRSLSGPPNQRGIYYSLDALAYLRFAQSRPIEAASLTNERRRATSDNPQRLYKVATDLALYLDRISPKVGDPADKRSSLRENLSLQAIQILRDAIRIGFRDVRRLQTDPTLQPLRNHRAFRDLVADLAFPANPFGPSK
jgi:serine/threonine protein kinase